MLNSLDIALLCDSRTVDGAGLAITPDRSRHGIHAQLGDGAAAGTMPTLDALNGKFDFDGGDYMVLRQADDVEDVLADMGSIQDETYLFYMDPVVDPGATDALWINTDDGANPRFAIGHRGGANDYFWIYFIDGVGGTETGTTPVGSALEFIGKSLLFAYVRRLNAQEVYCNGVLRWSSANASVDASGAKNPTIGKELGGARFFPAGTGLRVFGYSRTAWTQTQLRALQRFLRGML
jgi:hypothetical protein